ncbi:hypothetical protein [Actinorugispora endophytica]|uniref:Uncharacterized protein n=1 Tax=Actinorugispora endophytica TaxID=1605990 RepID=A0A4R6UX99_9ACTN|nr:hypothetical protein [Actinorugispora endophytica]TDQ48224.1 hypothetical protein EV190_11938 [Actinorugispora endophytica]
MPPVAPYNPNIPPPPNPYTNAPPALTPRAPVRTATGTVVLHYLGGLGAMLVMTLMSALGIGEGHIMFHVLFLGLVGVGLRLVFARGQRTDKALGSGLLTGALGAAATAVVLAVTGG